jgi:hypothetical protein
VAGATGSGMEEAWVSPATTETAGVVFTTTMSSTEGAKASGFLAFSSTTGFPASEERSTGIQAAGLFLAACAVVESFTVLISFLDALPPISNDLHSRANSGMDKDGKGGQTGSGRSCRLLRRKSGAVVDGLYPFPNLGWSHFGSPFLYR